MSVKIAEFGKTNDGKKVTAYTLENDSITSARIIDYGGTVVNLWVKDKFGKTADVICGFDDMYGYLNAGGNHGALIGRVCNRIKGGRFTLNGVNYQLFKNDGNNTLHGGDIGFNQKIWSVKVVSESDEPEIALTYVSPDMEENFPGTLTVTVNYKLTADGALSLHYTATTDKPTIVNLTNHMYFNAAGYDSGKIDAQITWLDSDKYNEVDGELIPTGKFIGVKGTAFDFNTPRAIGEYFDSDSTLKKCGGYDHNFVLNGTEGDAAKLCAWLKDDKSGRKMEVYTNQPCVQIYTTNSVDEDAIPFKGGVKPVKNCAVCFETQKMPDAINHPGFDNTVLNPGETYDYTTVYKFIAE